MIGKTSSVPKLLGMIWVLAGNSKQGCSIRSTIVDSIVRYVLILLHCQNPAQCKKNKIPITTFMIATDPYLQRFVQEFTEMNHGKAYFASLDNLGSFIFKDFESGKTKTMY